MCEVACINFGVFFPVDCYVFNFFYLFEYLYMYRLCIWVCSLHNICLW